VAGAALVVAAAFRKANSEGVHRGWLAERIGNFLRRVWVRATLSIAGFVLLAAIVFHGLIPLFFYEANSRGYSKLGDWTTRLYAATYFPVNGNTYLTEKLLQAEMGAGPAGRACVANDANACNNFGDFYFLIGWNWGRAWRFHAKTASLTAAKCTTGDPQTCFNLGVQYEDGRGVAVDLSKAAALYLMACDARYAEACQKLGDLHWYGIGFMADKQKGAALLKEGCALGSKWACQEVDFLRQSDSDWRPEFDR
jgi:TPR repeat protein